jgi:type VI secretion system protein ImpE
MTAVELYREGQLNKAIEALGDELRRQPADSRRRTFLFELLCFAGAYDRAEKQLDILAQGGSEALAGTMVYRAALHATRVREDMFRTGALPLGDATGGPCAGTLNGQPFEAIEDEDPRIGAHLEVFIAGSYTWVPFKYIARLEIAEPKRLRDLLWAPAILTATPEFRLQDLGEVLLPVLAPGSAAASDDAVRLGRMTVWQDGDEPAPLGQKALFAEGTAHPLLTIRELVLSAGEKGTGLATS